MVNLSSSFFEVLGICLLLIPYAIIYIILSFPILQKYILFKSFIPKKFNFTPRLRDKKLKDNNNRSDKINNNFGIIKNSFSLNHENQHNDYEKFTESNESISPFSISSLRTNSINISYSQIDSIRHGIYFNFLF